MSSERTLPEKYVSNRDAQHRTQLYYRNSELKGEGNELVFKWVSHLSVGNYFYILH